MLWVVFGPSAFDELVARQHGVISRAQCQATGLTDAAIRVRLAGDRWQRLFDGVYATFTGPPSRTALFWAVLLYAGEEAVLSHESAAELAGLVDEPAPLVHVTIPAERRVRPARGVAVHRSNRAAVARQPTREPARTRVEETVVDLPHEISTTRSAG